MLEAFDFGNDSGSWGAVCCDSNVCGIRIPGSPARGRRLSGGAIVGIVIGVIAVIAVVVFAIYAYRKRRAREEKDDSSMAEI
jgi:hypothetical protein